MEIQTRTCEQIRQEPINDPNLDQWITFIENLHAQEEGIPKPFYMVDTLVNKYLTSKVSTSPILDIGCETGKNAIPLLRAGYQVTLMDITPNAIRYTQERLGALGLEQGILESILGKIEELDPRYGPYQAVIGTYVFSFIPPNLFHDVMINNVLNRVEPGGYFVGGFFGKEHSWASDPKLSVVTQERLKNIFETAGFEVCEIDEHQEEVITIQNGKQVFHVIAVIARR